MSREALLLATMFGIYNLGRWFAAEQTGSAFGNAYEVLALQRWLHLPKEASLQRAALQLPALIESANLYYAFVHFPITVVVLFWLGIRRPAAYPNIRWTLAAMSGLALIGHIAFPLAPPRMMPGLVDTGLAFGQSVYGSDRAGTVANQFAAMPSLHVGWAALIALSMILTTSSPWRWLWLAHPTITFAVMIVTANHYWLDGLAALFCWR
ncbi:phosphatase PAP2 family protein [Kribbella sp. NPDC051587]|uniref:phosphatase PAP2 family protein n=1 Tax=Kribbella sp. NPDC051587 TaxID=3364119 RepID=UPI0037B14C2A